jgi:hypothetical protein
VAEVLAQAVSRYGPEFGRVLESSRVWVNGEPAAPADPLSDADEVAVLPPVSGGAVDVSSGGSPVDPSGAGPAVPGVDIGSGAGALAAVAVGTRPEPAEAAEAAEAKKQAQRPLRLRPQPPRLPHGRLGLAWALTTALAAFLGALGLALWLLIGAGPALVALARSWRGQDGRKAMALAGAALGLAVLASALLESRSVTLVALMLTLVCVFDASRYLVGWGAAASWEGPLAGVAAVGVASLAAAVIRPSPAGGNYAWVLGGLIAAAGVLGAPALRRLEGPAAPEGRGVGPLRRYGTLWVAAPLVLLVALLGHL